VACTGSYGAGLARYLATQQVPVVEVNQPDRSTRRRRGKTDAVDAEAAARAALSGIARALPKSGDGQVEVLRMLRLAKNSAVKARTQALNQLKAVRVNAPSALREELEPLSTSLLVRRCAELADTRGATRQPTQRSSRCGCWHSVLCSFGKKPPSSEGG
jgi:transposase